MKTVPLKGINIVDLTQAMAGPFCTMLLGDLGAEVIKVEPLTGDQTRKWAPIMNGMSAYFLSINRNKKSIAIDLKKEEGKEILKKLIKKSDVFVENFKPGIIEKLGFSYDDVSKINDSIIYCSISGYGRNGPMMGYPAYDITILATTGLMSITGEEGRPPVKMGIAIADIVTALFAAISIISALYEREKTSKGQYIDISMFDSNLQILAQQAFSFFATGEISKRLGSAHSSIAPYQAFETSDGYIVIGVATERMWQDFCSIIGREDLLKNPNFSDNFKRVKYRELLANEIGKTLIKFKRDDLFKILKEKGIPAAPILNVKEALDNEQVKARNMLTYITGKYGKIPMLGSVFKFSRSKAKIRYPPPMLGENTEEILKNIGYNEKEIELLKHKNVINKEIKMDVEI
jgi:Predicted acyl-CoA transferases/carnitine dehydratase